VRASERACANERGSNECGRATTETTETKNEDEDENENEDREDGRSRGGKRSTAKTRRNDKKSKRRERWPVDVSGNQNVRRLTPGRSRVPSLTQSVRQAVQSVSQASSSSQSVRPPVTSVGKLEAPRARARVREYRRQETGERASPSRASWISSSLWDGGGRKGLLAGELALELKKVCLSRCVRVE
jgi:hypothetical protein